MKIKDIIIDVLIISFFIGLVGIFNFIDNRDTKKIEIEEKAPKVAEVSYVEEADEIVFEGMTLDELADKLNKSLKSDLAGSGYYYAKYAMQYQVDPYLAVAISLHETGCNNKCSYMVVNCNNVGGQKFKPACGNSAYGRNDTLEQGIERFVRNIAVTYYAYGLTTPELMVDKYEGTGSKTWAPAVNRYINAIKSR